MHIINQKIEQVFVITSPYTYYRLDRLIPILKQEDIRYKIIVAPDKRYYNEPAQSLISANESILLESKINRYDSICIIEDDIYFVDNYKEKFECFYNRLNKWDILKLGYQPHCEYKDIHKVDIVYKIKQNDNAIGTQINCYNISVYDILLNVYKKSKIHLDIELNKLYYKFLSYTPVKHIFYGCSYREYEKDKSEAYKCYPSSLT